MRVSRPNRANAWSILGPFWVHIGSILIIFGFNQHLDKTQFRQEFSLDKNFLFSLLKNVASEARQK